MALMPNVVDGEVIEAAWGNAIRDRTIQQFANAAERNAWAAPNGCFAVTVDNGALAKRMAGTWVYVGTVVNVSDALGGDVNAPASANTQVLAWNFNAVATGQVAVVSYTAVMTQASAGSFDLSFTAGGMSVSHQFASGGSFLISSGSLIVRAAGLIQARLNLNCWGAKATLLKQPSSFTCVYSPIG